MRHNDWPALMAEAIKKAGKQGFSWGENDCCLFACDVVLAITGVDYAEEFRGRYKTEIGAARALKNIGAGSLIDTVDKIVGERKPLARAMRGDFVLTSQNGNDMLGICLGEYSAFLCEKGFYYEKTLQCKSSWSVN